MNSVSIKVVNKNNVLPTLVTVIAKPTKACNADCDYCCAPPYDEETWNIEDFKFYFDKLYPHMRYGALWLWHGGEPTLLSPKFYKEAENYAISVGRGDITFSMQSNILNYTSERWKDVFLNTMNNRISTSFDPDEEHRTIKGNVKTYSRIFKDRLEDVSKDGIRLTVISTFNRFSAKYMGEMYNWAKEADSKGIPFDLRFNYRYPAGREQVNLNSIDILPPKIYGEELIKIYNDWIKELPNFKITPLDQMFGKVLGFEESRCPWTKSCGGKFLGIEPNGDTYNCSEFADTLEEEYRFGNLKEQDFPELMASKAAIGIKRRRFVLPESCLSCRHFKQCEGGCARDSVLYNRGLGGKFYYCESWKMVFDRIKESIKSGEAENAINKYYS